MAEKSVPEQKFLRCERCGRDRSEHFAANLTDGPFVGQYLMICPTVGFKSAGMEEWQAGLHEYAVKAEK